METRPQAALDSKAPAPPPRTRRRRLLMALSALVALLLLIVGLFPMWASTNQGKGYVLDQINRDLRGKLTVERWSLGWFSGLEAWNVTLMDKNARPIAFCSHIKTELTLSSILLGKYDFGDGTLTQPQLFLRRYADGSTNVDRLLEQSRSSANRTQASLERMIQHLRGALRVEGGTLILSADGTSEIICMRDIQADIPIASPLSPVHLSLVGNATHEQQKMPVSIEAGVPSLTAWVQNPLIVLQDLNIRAGAIPVAALAAWAGLSPQWEQSFGPLLETFRLENHEPRGSPWSTPHLEAAGARGKISLSLLMETTPTLSTVSLLDTPDYWARLQCAPSPPADALLAYFNPFIAGAVSQTGSITLTLTDLQLPLRQPGTGRAAGILTLDHVREKVPQKLRGLGIRLTAGTQETEIVVPAVRFVIAAHRLAYDSMTVQFPPSPPLTFSGSIGLDDGSVRLLLTGPIDGAGALSSGQVQLPVRGTVGDPQVMRPAAVGP